MPFGPKRTVGISGHCSEAQSGSMQKSVEDMEASGKQWKTVEDKRKVRKTCGSEWKTRKGPEGVKGHGRGWKRREDLGKVTVRYIDMYPDCCFYLI